MSNRQSEQTKNPAVKNLAPKDETKIKAGRKAGGTQQEYLTITLEQARVSS